MADTTSITKADMARQIYIRSLDDKKRITRAEARGYVDAFFTMLEEHFMANHAVKLTHYGRLSPYFKPGGREVRNPKTKTSKAMHDVVTVSLVRTSTTQIPKASCRISTGDLIRQMAELSTRTEADLVVRIILENIRKTGLGTHHMEIREFGTFLPRWSEPRKGRNPKTGAPVEVPGKWKPAFKISKKLRARLTEAYTHDHCA